MTSPPTVVLAFEGDPPSKEAAIWAAFLAHRAEAQVMVVSAAGLSELAQPERWLSEGLEELAELGVPARGCVRYDAEDMALDEVARTEGASLIVLGTHALPWPFTRFVGSIAERTLRGAVCPVLIVRKNVRHPRSEQLRLTVAKMAPTDMAQAKSVRQLASQWHAELTEYSGPVEFEPLMNQAQLSDVLAIESLPVAGHHPILSATAYRLIREAPCPVLAIRGG
jgi:nucleotide-binding universal stress UspA family protein